MSNGNALSQFFFEIKRLDEARGGWKKLGESQAISAHVLRAAQICFVLAHLENYPNPFEVVTLVVFHDNDETRTGCADPLAKKYSKIDKTRVVQDQIAGLELIGDAIFSLWQRVETKSDTAAIIAKDADYLEMAVTAREINHRRSNGRAQPWIEDARRLVRTVSAKKLLTLIETSDPDEWWNNAEADYRK